VPILNEFAVREGVAMEDAAVSTLVERERVFKPPLTLQLDVERLSKFAMDATTNWFPAVPVTASGRRLVHSDAPLEKEAITDIRLSISAMVRQCKPTCTVTTMINKAENCRIVFMARLTTKSATEASEVLNVWE